MATVPRHEEVKRILAVYNNSEPEVQRLLTMQLATLHNRAQVLLGLSGIAITTTGFSGRAIAGTSATGQVLIISGVSMVLLAAIIVVAGVMRLSWLSQVAGDTLEARLETMLVYRDAKVVYYRIAIFALLIGLTLYVAAIANMLAHPDAHVPPPIYR